MTETSSRQTVRTVTGLVAALFVAVALVLEVILVENNADLGVQPEVPYLALAGFILLVAGLITPVFLYSTRHVVVTIVPLVLVQVGSILACVSLKHPAFSLLCLVGIASAPAMEPSQRKVMLGMSPVVVVIQLTLGLVVHFTNTGRRHTDLVAVVGGAGLGTLLINHCYVACFHMDAVDAPLQAAAVDEPAEEMKRAKSLRSPFASPPEQELNDSTIAAVDGDMRHVLQFMKHIVRGDLEEAITARSQIVDAVVGQGAQVMEEWASMVMVFAPEMSESITGTTSGSGFCSSTGFLAPNQITPNPLAGTKNSSGSERIDMCFERLRRVSSVGHTQNELPPRSPKKSNGRDSVSTLSSISSSNSGSLRAVSPANSGSPSNVQWAARGNGRGHVVSAFPVAVDYPKRGSESRSNSSSGSFVGGGIPSPREVMRRDSSINGRVPLKSRTIAVLSLRVCCGPDAENRRASFDGLLSACEDTLRGSKAVVVHCPDDALVITWGANQFVAEAPNVAAHVALTLTAMVEKQGGGSLHCGLAFGSALCGTLGAGVFRTFRIFSDTMVRASSLMTLAVDLHLPVIVDDEAAERCHTSHVLRPIDVVEYRYHREPASPPGSQPSSPVKPTFLAEPPSFRKEGKDAVLVGPATLSGKAQATCHELLSVRPDVGMDEWLYQVNRHAVNEAEAGLDLYREAFSAFRKGSVHEADDKLNEFLSKPENRHDTVASRLHQRVRSVSFVSQGTSGSFAHDSDDRSASNPTSSCATPTEKQVPLPLRLHSAE